MSIDTDEVINERGKHYGVPGEFFEQLSLIWTGLLSNTLKPAQSSHKEGGGGGVPRGGGGGGKAEIGHAVSKNKQNKTKLRDQQLLKDAEEG